jgi:hypothetical protein
MGTKKDKIQSSVIIAMAWLMAIALIYIVILKIRLLNHS